MNHQMLATDLVGHIARSVQAYGYRSTRSHCGRYQMIYPASADASCSIATFYYDDLKAALKAWRWVIGG